MIKTLQSVLIITTLIQTLYSSVFLPLLATTHTAALRAAAQVASMAHPYYFDTGASYHMTGYITHLADVTKLDESISVKTPAGKIWVEYAGSVQIQPFHPRNAYDPPINLTNVLYCPNSEINLISAGKVMDTCTTVQESSDTLSVYYNADGRLLFKAVKNSADVFPIGTSVTDEPFFDGSPASDVVLATLGRKSAMTAELLHRRLGHTGYSTMLEMHKSGAFDGLGVTEEDIRSCMTGPKCEVCLQGKMTALPFPSSTSPTDDILHVDVCQLEFEPHNGYKYIVVGLHEPTDYSFVFSVANKSSAAEAVKRMVTYIATQTQYIVRRLRADNGREFLSTDLTQFVQQQGIKPEWTIPYTPQQNGKAERLNRTLQDITRCLLIEAQLPTSMWVEAMHTANFIRNITLRPSKGITPYGEFWGKPPPYPQLRTYGCKAYVLIPKHMRSSKLTSVCEIGMLVGYCTNAKGYRILTLDETGAYCVNDARNVVFDETIIGLDAVFKSKRQRSPSPTDDGNEPLLTDGDNSPDAADSTDEPVLPSVRGRSGRITKTPAWLDEYVTTFTGDGEEVLGATKANPLEPLTVDQALSSPQKDYWQKAMNDEYASLMANNTYQLVPCPPGVKPIPCKWVLTVKRNATGDIVRHKARIVIKGFKQQYGVDYAETFSPTARLPYIRALLAHACVHGWELHHVDIDTAFLHGTLKEDVYMVQPEGYSNGDPNIVCKLNKSLYGLKQAPKVWHDTLKEAFAEFGFTTSMADQCVLIHKEKSTKTYALIYVDDQIITGPDPGMINHIKRLLLGKFPGKDLKEPSLFVGIGIHRDTAAKAIKLTQVRHIDDLVIAFGQSAAKGTSVPMNPDEHINLEPNASEPLSNETKTEYASLVGSLLYVALATRPDIQYAVSVLCRFMHNPTRNHLKAALRVLNYLNKTRTFGLLYRLNGNELNSLRITGYSDSNFANDPTDYISTYGFTFQYCGAAISWRSKKQDRIAHSTAEAEFVAASFASKEAMWLKKVLADFDIPGPISIAVDNTAALKYMLESEYTPRNKHVGVHFSALRERAILEDVTFHQIATTDNIADIFTKPLSRQPFERLRSMLGVHNCA